MRRLLTVVGAVLLCLMVVAGGALADQAYSDSRGDAGVGTDITNLTVRNDASGNVSIQVAVANPLVENHAIAVYVDADRNKSTGASGDDYLMIGGPLYGAEFLAWNGSDWVEVNAAGFSIGGAATSVMEFRFHRSAIRNASSFAFGAVSVSIDNGSAGIEFKVWDVAPNSGDYIYSLSSSQCSNGLDDDGDGLVDYPADPGCSSAADNNEANANPPPTPKPPAGGSSGATIAKAPRLPARVTFTGRSVKHVRLGEKLYRTVKYLHRIGRIGVPRVVSVACWSSDDWNSIVGRDADRIVGFWTPKQPRWLHIAPVECRDIQSLMNTRAINARRAFAVGTILHERLHAEGVRNEAATECLAVQLVYYFARELNFVHTKALRLEQLAVRASRNFGAKGYWNTSKCRDGGAWDLFPEYTNLTY